MNVQPVITSFYAALFSLLVIPMILAVVYRRRSQRISLGDGGDALLQKRVRAHANFVETVPLALILMLLVELNGAGPALLHVLGSLLLVGRVVHYLQLTDVVRSFRFRVAGMLATISVYVVSSLWLLLSFSTSSL